jgi:hypothetical protein
MAQNSRDFAMEFIRINRLKQTLKAGELPAIETAKYLAGQAMLGAILYVPSPGDAPLDWALIAYPLLALGGVYYCYRQNGGRAGLRLAERFLSIGWVIGWRVCAVLILIFLAAVIISLVRTGAISWLEDPAVGDQMTVAGLFIVAFIYWRMGRHLADVHSVTSASRSLTNAPAP